MALPFRVPVCHPLLPNAAALLPYLEEIDGARWYSNYGPLHRRFQAALADRCGVTADQLTIVSSGTSGLAQALRASVAGDGLCLMPAWTFIATPMAARMAGLSPWFVDIEQRSWSLTPEIAERHLAMAPEPVAAIVPVAPFGDRVPVDEWDDLAERTGVPVVIDAAAGFDSLRVGRSPSIVSLHATKSLGIGEGGVVFSTDAALIRRVQQSANLGLQAGRIAGISGTNAKLSEYGCAIGLAALDQWPAQRAALLERAAHYRRCLAETVSFQPGFGSVATATCVVWLPRGDVGMLADRLAAEGVETLRWWHAACPDHPAFMDALSGDIPVSRLAARQAIGLPMSVTLPLEEIDRIALLVRRHVKHGATVDAV